MSLLDEAIKLHMKHIVLREERPFTFADFNQFELEGKLYKMSHGTFRNKISALIKCGAVELDYRSGISFYTMKGHRFSRLTKNYHTGVTTLIPPKGAIGRQSPLYKWLRNLPVEKQSLHNIRLRFSANGIWESCARVYPQQLIGSRNQDIRIPPWTFCSDINSVATIHHTDVISIALGCSFKPIALDIEGILNCIESLTRTEERLARLVGVDITIPCFREWIGTCWHFGVDSIDTYNGDRFCITLEQGISDIYTIYTKRWRDGKVKPRIERQEYSKNPFVDVFMSKLYPDGNLSEYGSKRN